MLERETPGAKIILVGTKADIEQERVITDEVFKSLAKTLNVAHCTITSANTGLGVKELFADSARLYLPQKAVAIKGGFFDESKAGKGESLPQNAAVIRRKSFP